MMNHVAGAIFLLLVLIGASLLWCIPASKDRSSPDLMEKRLANLGYITRTPTDTESGTRVHDRNAMAPGVNLYCSETGTTATFVNADGKHLAAARFSISETRYQSNLCKVVKPWLHDLAMVVEYSAVARFNMKTGPRWALQGAFHHDIAIDGERLFAMADASRVINFADQTYPIVDTQIVEVSSQGLIRRSWSFADLVMDDPSLHTLLASGLAYAGTITSVTRGYLDVFHLNTISVLPREIELANGLSAPAGALLVGARNLHTVAVLDLNDERVVWAWGRGELEQPHHPSLLPNGNILIFDNGNERRWSRVIELDPRREEIVWQYGAPEGKDFFFSETRGSAQRLSNGNTLVTDSISGRVFEVTRDGRIVWEFINPDVNDGKRATIFQMTRLDVADAKLLGVPSPL